MEYLKVRCIYYTICFYCWLFFIKIYKSYICAFQLKYFIICAGKVHDIESYVTHNIYQITLYCQHRSSPPQGQILTTTCPGSYSLKIKFRLHIVLACIEYLFFVLLIFSLDIQITLFIGVLILKVASFQFLHSALIKNMTFSAPTVIKCIVLFFV